MNYIYGVFTRNNLNKLAGIISQLIIYNCNIIININRISIKDIRLIKSYL